MPDISLRQAALAAGLGMLGMTLLAPYADLVVLPELLVPGDAGRTAENIRENRLLFVSGALGYLVYRSGFLPAILGALLVIAGVGYVIDALGPYLVPDLDLGVTTFTFVGELIFMLWLLIRGRRLTGSVTDGTTAVG